MEPAQYIFKEKHIAPTSFCNTVFRKKTVNLLTRSDKMDSRRKELFRGLSYEQTTLVHELA